MAHVDDQQKNKAEQPHPTQQNTEASKTSDTTKKAAASNKWITFKDTDTKIAGAKREVELNFDRYYSAARQKAKEYEELALMVKKVFGLDPYVPEKDRIQTALYRLGAPELLEAYRECVRAAEIDRKGAVTEDYCTQLKWDRIKQAIDRLDKEIDQILARSGMNDVMFLGLNGVAELWIR